VTKIKEPAVPGLLSALSVCVGLYVVMAYDIRLPLRPREMAQLLWVLTMPGFPACIGFFFLVHPLSRFAAAKLPDRFADALSLWITVSIAGGTGFFLEWIDPDDESGGLLRACFKSALMTILIFLPPAAIWNALAKRRGRGAGSARPLSSA
jgi:hypothetical protein